MQKGFILKGRESIEMRTNNWTKVLVLIWVGAIGLIGVAQADSYSEDFESYSPGQKIGAHPGLLCQFMVECWLIMLILQE